jgi:hypothetical protein
MQRQGCRLTILFAISLLLLPIFSVSATTDAKPRIDLMDQYLIQAIQNESNSETELSVIFQFEEQLSVKDKQQIHLIEIEILNEALLINGGLLKATPSQIVLLSNQPGIKFLELNRLLETFYLDEKPSYSSGTMMQETTHVVNATTAWSRVTIQRDGSIRTETNGQFFEWDGKGTTAVDLDTGVDAEHPDFDYVGPWAGDKVIYSAKYDGTGWTETKNSDTSSGHGTHVGGTIAGNGDASAGRRMGTAKGAWLVALGTGDGVSIFAAEQGLEWVYENSRPGLNSNNIRVVSNSWGTDGDYNPEGAIATVTEKLTYDNGVAVIFAASNSGGSGAEGDSDLRTNVYANTPSAISVAAMTHDGSQVTSFSSRGWMSQQHTWPDIAAPGREIWSTAPRRTVIDLSSRPTDQDLYYMAISGTSMATPHIGGIAALLIGAAPSLGAADYQREDHDSGTSLVTGENPQGYDQEDWAKANNTRVHEVELIMELTSDYFPNNCESGNDEDDCTDIPEPCHLSLTGLCHDWRIGHGLVNVDRALALARTLQLLRDSDGDGIVDTEATVWDALAQYENLMQVKKISLQTDRLSHSWKGEWSHWNNGPSGTFGTYTTDDRHFVWIPNGTSNLEATFTIVQRNIEEGLIGQHSMTIDIGETGDNDAGQGEREGDTVYYSIEIEESMWNSWAEFDIVGNGITLIPFNEPDDEFYEPLFAYTVDVALTFDLSQDWEIEIPERPDFYTDLDPAPATNFNPEGGRIIMIRNVYDESAIIPLDSNIPMTILSRMPIVTVLTLTIVLIGLLGAAFHLGQRIPPENEMLPTALLESEGAELEAELIEAGSINPE